MKTEEFRKEIIDSYMKMWTPKDETCPTKWTINLDGSVDVEGDIIIYNADFYKFPFKFRNFTGIFKISADVSRKLTNFENLPDNLINDGSARKLEISPDKKSWIYCIIEK